MIIERTYDLQEILRCLPFEVEIRKKGRDKIRLSKMLLFMQSQLDNPMFGFWIAYDSEEERKPDDPIIGYMIATINLMPGFEALYVQRMYAKTREVRKEFEKILFKKWAKEYKIKKAIMTASKNIKAFKRYNFTPVSVNMERRI